jgi:hypothetical protein
MANTAFPTHNEGKILNLLLRGATLAPYTGALYLAFLTNSTSDTSLVELAPAGTYTGSNGRVAFSGATQNQFTKFGTSTSTAADTSGALADETRLINLNPITFTASGVTHSGIVGIAICSTQAVNATSSAMATDTSVILYGDLTGGSVTLTPGQSITFAAGAIVVSLD